MMVEQTDLVRLRMVRMSNVPDTLYMVGSAVPQRCHVVSHQQLGGTHASPQSLVANEIPGEAASLGPAVYAPVNERLRTLVLSAVQYPLCVVLAKEQILTS